MLRIFAIWVVCLFSLPVYADQQSYPFKLAYRAEAGGHVVLAQNNGPAPILVTVGFANSVNVKVEPAEQVTAVVRPNETLPIASVHAADAKKNYRLASSFKFSIGDPAAVPDPAATYRLPFQNGQKVMIGQTFGGRITTHTGEDSKYAVDFDVPIGTPVLAARGGIVVDIDQGYTEGGNDPRLRANHVLILQQDGTLAQYSHLSANRVTVTFGQKVEAGTLIGYSGNTGYSSGPHLHFAVLTNSQASDGNAKYRSIQVNFVNGAPGWVIHFTQDEVVVVNFLGQQQVGTESAAGAQRAPMPLN